MTSLTWQYEEETISLEKDQENNWTYPADAAFPLDQSYPDAMVQALKEIQAAKTIENVEDLSEYGLEDAVCSITVQGEKEYQLAIGEETGLGGSGIFPLGTAMFTWWTPPCWIPLPWGCMILWKKRPFPHDRPARGTDHHQRRHAVDGIPGGQRPGIQ